MLKSRSASQLLRRVRRKAAWRMRLPLVVASLLCSVAWASDPPQPPKKGGGRKHGLVIQVQGDGWGRATPEDVRTVLEATAAVLVERLSEPLAAPIVVSHTDGPPMALYGRGPHGEYRIRLHAQGENWHLYAYEFAHELCHLLSNHDAHPGPDETKHPNQWFEETVCETASLYALSRLAERWAQTPPEPRWAGEAGLFQRFFELLISEGHRHLPVGTPVGEWLRDNEQALRRNPYLRQKNEVLANLLLPLFESDPGSWQVVAYLNRHPEAAQASLRAYLARWYADTPVAKRSVVTEVLVMLELDGILPDN